LSEWMARQYPISVAKMLGAISATHLVKERRGFGQIIQPLPGSVLASTALGAWDPDPDYFFHWQRDSAIVIDALRHVITEGSAAKEGISRFKEFIVFSLSLNRLDGHEFLRESRDFRKKIEPFFLQYVRDDDELAAISGDRVLGEPRFNPDATLDISKWSRPQHDGPALRALALMRFWPLDRLDPVTRSAMGELIETDLGFVLAHWRELSFDIWEEELGQHYSTRLLHHAALADGVLWMRETGMNDATQQACLSAAQEIAQSLDVYWRPERGFYTSRREVAHPLPGRELDFATILAVIHAGRKKGAHSVCDPKVMATLAQLEALFEARYEINRGRPENRGPALGRYDGDAYFSGGAYYFSTLGAAEIYYTLAGAVASGVKLSVTADNKAFLSRLRIGDDNFSGSPREALNHRFEALLRRGDQFMAMVAAYTPESGELSEQFDQTTGAQTSAKTLTWSHAAFISAFASRSVALQARKFPVQTGASR
jgi:glucoamylase